MKKYSIKNIDKNRYVRQDCENAPITLVEEKERTIFHQEHEAETLRAMLDDNEADCYVMIEERE